MRAIIPIYIESCNLLIKSIDDVVRIKNEKPKIYNKIILSKELIQFFYGLAKNRERESAIEQYNIMAAKAQDGLIGDVYINDTIIDNIANAFIELLPKKYFIESLPSKIHFMGYHTQKTVFYLQEDLIIDAEDIKFSYVSFIAERKDIKIIISNNTKANFSNVIFGECEVVVKDNAKCWFSNILCNGATRAIVQQGNGCIEKTENVKFNKNKYNYYIENFYSLTMKNIDKENLSAIEDLILYSYIKNFFIEKDMDLSGIGKLYFANTINFKAVYPYKYYQLILPDVFIGSNMHIDQNIIVKGNIIIKEVENKICSLGTLVGKISFNASLNVRIVNTCLLGALSNEDYPIELVNSSVIFDKVYADGNEKVIKAMNSNFIIVNSNINNVGTLCHYMFMKENEDDIFKEKNICNISNSSIITRSLVTADKEAAYPTVLISNSSVVGTDSSNTIDYCKYIEIYNSQISNPYGCAVNLKGIEAVIEKSSFVSSKIGIKAIRNAFVVMKNNIIERNLVGMDVFDAVVFQKDANLFRNNQMALALSVCDDNSCYEKIVFYYKGTIFKDNKQDFKRKPGALSKRIENDWEELVEKVSNERKSIMSRQREV